MEHRSAVRCELVADVVRAFGSARLKVTGASMIPALWPGDMITVRHDATAGLLPGQIVLYRREDKLVAHRIVHIHNDSFIIRGDALPQDDPPISESDIVGKVVAIVRNGRTVHLRQPRWQRALSSMLQRSDLCLRMSLRWHNRVRRVVWTG